MVAKAVGPATAAISYSCQGFSDDFGYLEAARARFPLPNCHCVAEASGSFGSSSLR